MSRHTLLQHWSAPENADNPVGRLSEAWADVLAIDERAPEVVMVLEVILGSGIRLRASAELVESVDVLGHDRWSAPVLSEQPAVEQDYNVGNASAGARALAFRVPSWWLQPFEQVREGHPIAAFGEVSLLRSGMPWRDRLVIMRGAASGGVSYGAARSQFTDRDGVTDIRDSGTVTLEITDPREAADISFPPWTIDETRWPEAHRFGQPYNVVCGKGWLECQKVAPADKGTMLVAEGHGWDVQQVFRDGAAVNNWDVEEVADGDGLPVTVVHSLSGAPVSDTDHIQAFVVSIAQKPGPNLIDVVHRLLVNYAPDSSLLTNPDLFASARARLPNLPIGTVCNSRTTLFRFIEEGVLNDFPMVSMVWEGGRYGPVVTDWRAAPRMTLTLGDGLLLDRVGDPVQTQGSQVNDFTLRYGYNGVIDDFERVLVANPENSATCAASEEEAGPRRAPDVDSVQIQDDAAAGVTQDWQVQHEAMPTTFEQYTASPLLWWLLRRGDPVLLNDHNHPWVDARATVESMRLQRGQILLGLRVWSGKYRDGRLPSE